MTSADDNFGLTSTNSPNTNTINVPSSNQPINAYHRRYLNQSTHPYANPTGMELRLLMTFRDAGAVIGKGGSSIQKLRADFPRTIIQVPDCASPERILIINGDPDQCYEALYQIIPVLTDSARLSAFNRRRIQTNQIESNSNSNEKLNSNENQVEIRLLVYQIYCGAIIGKGGQQVKELRQTHNLDIKVFSVCCPMSHERLIALRGKINDVIECIRHIYSLMIASTQQIRGGPLIPYDPHNFDVYAVNEYGGFAASGNMDNRLGYNPRNPYLPAVAGGGAPRAGVGVYPIQALAPLVDVPYGGGPGLGVRYPTGVITATRVTLPNELVGAIIGPRGSKIQQIRQITQANIIIDDQSIPNGTGGGDRIITIEGLPEQISRAQALLQQAVRQSGLWRP